MDAAMLIVVVATALCAGASGGTFLAFSTFVMPALRRLPTRQAVAAMRQVNVLAPRSAFMVPLMGSAIGSCLIGTWTVLWYDGPRGLLLTGVVLNLLAFAVTGMRNVPLNNGLARLSGGVGDDTAAEEGAWSRYACTWTRWNHVRTLASLVAACSLTAALA